MQKLNTQRADTHNLMDYTAVPAGWQIRGQLWTGQTTASTATCPKCERIGVASAHGNGDHLIVHTGRVDGNTLEGIDYCNLRFDATDGN